VILQAYCLPLLGRRWYTWGAPDPPNYNSCHIMDCQWAHINTAGRNLSSRDQTATSVYAVVIKAGATGLSASQYHNWSLSSNFDIFTNNGIYKIRQKHTFLPIVINVFSINGTHEIRSDTWTHDQWNPCRFLLKEILEKVDKTFKINHSLCSIRMHSRSMEHILIKHMHSRSMEHKWSTRVYAQTAYKCFQKE
jgi:hypothetical protein